MVIVVVTMDMVVATTGTHELVTSFEILLVHETSLFTSLITQNTVDFTLKSSIVCSSDSVYLA